MDFQFSRVVFQPRYIDAFASVISKHMTWEMPGIFNKLLFAYFQTHTHTHIAEYVNAEIVSTRSSISHIHC